MLEPMLYFFLASSMGICVVFIGLVLGYIYYSLQESVK